MAAAPTARSVASASTRRLDNVQAAILHVKLKRYDESIARRRRSPRSTTQRLRRSARAAAAARRRTPTISLRHLPELRDPGRAPRRAAGRARRGRDRHDPAMGRPHDPPVRGSGAARQRALCRGHVAALHDAADEHRCSPTTTSIMSATQIERFYASAARGVFMDKSVNVSGGLRTGAEAEEASLNRALFERQSLVLGNRRSRISPNMCGGRT